MALFDITPAQSHEGGSIMVRSFIPTAAATILAGEPVELVAAGTVSEGTSPVIIADGFYGIAASPSVDIDGTLRQTIEVYDPKGVYFRSRFFSNAGGAGVNVFPLALATARAAIGDGVGLVLSAAGNWTPDSSTATNIGRIVDFLDATGRSVTNALAGAAVQVVIEFTAGQSIGSVADA